MVSRPARVVVKLVKIDETPPGVCRGDYGLKNPIRALAQRELLTASATLRPLNPRHVRYLHRGELRMELTNGAGIASRASPCRTRTGGGG